MREIEEHYYKTVMPQVRESIRAFKDEMGDYGKCLSLSAWYEQLEDVEWEIKHRHRKYIEGMKEDAPYIERAMVSWPLEELYKKARSLKSKIRGITLPKEDGERITQDMIDRARDYPLEQLVEIRRGFARCVWHEDRNPSMFCKGNFAHCFSCGHTGDAIDVYMAINGVSFVDAVRALC